MFAAGYTASKGAIAAMTKTIALDVAKHGIVANSICPGCKILIHQTQSGNANKVVSSLTNPDA